MAWFQSQSQTRPKNSATVDHCLSVCLVCPLTSPPLYLSWAFFSRASHHIFNSKYPHYRLQKQASTGELLNAAVLTCVVIDKPWYDLTRQLIAHCAGANSTRVAMSNQATNRRKIRKQALVCHAVTQRNGWRGVIQPSFKSFCLTYEHFCQCAVKSNCNVLQCQSRLVPATYHQKEPTITLSQALFYYKA